MSGVNYQIVIRMDSAAIKLVIDKDRTGELNKKIFDWLYERKDKIEEAFGKEINWRRMDNQISSRIEYDIDGCGLNDESTWGQGYEVIAEMLVKWDEAFRPYYSEIRNLYNFRSYTAAYFIYNIGVYLMPFFNCSVSVSANPR